MIERSRIAEANAMQCIMFGGLDFVRLLSYAKVTLPLGFAIGKFNTLVWHELRLNNTGKNGRLVRQDVEVEGDVKNTLLFMLQSLVQSLRSVAHVECCL